MAGGDKYKYKYKVPALKYTPGGAPPEPGEDDDPGDDVEDGGEQGEDHLQLHEGERQLHLGFNWSSTLAKRRALTFIVSLTWRR